MWANEDAVGGSPEPAATRAPARRRIPLRGAVSLAVALAVVAWAPPADAACRFNGVTDMTFSGYSPVGGAVAATATLTYRCTGITSSASLAITPTTRTMTSGASTLSFQLYTDAARTTVFPGSPAVTIPVVANGTVTVYGYITAQDVVAGNYARTLTATLVSNGITTRTTTFTASATVLPVCTIQPATLAFGSYNPTSGTPLDAGTSISVACTRGTAYNVGLSAGGYASGSIRQMAGPNGGRLQYELYSNSGRTTVWNTTAVLSGTTGSSASILLNVFGRIPAGQMVQAGDYADVVTSTINF
jgi:spore coat protein U-like protein